MENQRGFPYIPAGLLTNLFGAVFARRKYGLSGCARNIPRIPKPKQGVQHVRTASRRHRHRSGKQHWSGLCATLCGDAYGHHGRHSRRDTAGGVPGPMPSPCGSTSESLIHALIWLRKPGNTADRYRRAQRGHHTPRLLHSGYARGRMGERHQGQSDRGLLSGQGLHSSDAGSQAGRHGALFFPGRQNGLCRPRQQRRENQRALLQLPRRGSSRSSSRWQWSLPPTESG